VIPATLPLGDGDTVLGVPEGVADGVGDVDGVPVADAVADGLADPVADEVAVGVALVVALGGAVGVALVDVGAAEEGEALPVLLGVEEADALVVSLGTVDVAVPAELDPLEHAASANGRATRASVRPGRRPSLREAAVTRRSSLIGMGFSWRRGSYGEANVRRPPSRALRATCGRTRPRPSQAALTVRPCGPGTVCP